MASSLRQRLLSGAKSYGPVCMSDSPIVMESIAMAGYGHMIIDHEHSPTDSSSGQALLQAVDAARFHYQHQKVIHLSPSSSSSSTKSFFATEPIIRVPDHDPTYMKKILDSMRLPGGVLVPMVEDAETAANVVAATRYPVQLWQEEEKVEKSKAKEEEEQQQKQKETAIDGIRGCAIPFIRASGYGQIPTKEYMEQCQRDLLIMVQVETEKGVDAIPDIASIPGIDGIFLGPFDLSCSVGKVAQFDDPMVVELMERAEQSVLNSGASSLASKSIDGSQNQCFLAGFQSNHRSLAEMFDAGYSLVCGSVDLGLLRNATKADVEQANEIIHR